ncbi:MAG: DUF2213 domain-containing protein, partial [Nannocystaceae bacterium]
VAHLQRFDGFAAARGRGDAGGALVDVHATVYARCMAQICDVFQPELERNLCPRTGALTVRYAPTWVGVRDYHGPDGVLRALHHPDQVQSAGFHNTLKRMVSTPGHPEGWVHVRAGAGNVPVRDVQVGHAGDAIEMRPCAEWPEIEVPTVQVTVTDALVIDAIMAGRCSQSSLGYEAVILDEPGVWVAPDGSEHPYDIIHLLDPTDPRALPTTGANHLALLPAGRGGAQSAVMYDAATLPSMPETPDTTAAEQLQVELEALRKRVSDMELENEKLAGEVAAMAPDAEAGAAMRLEAAKALALAHGVEATATDPAGVVAEVLMAVAPDALQGMSPGDPGYDQAVRAAEAVLMALQPTASEETGEEDEKTPEELQDAAPKKTLVDDTVGDTPVNQLFSNAARLASLFGG